MAEKYAENYMPAPIMVHTSHGPQVPSLGIDFAQFGINAGVAIVPVSEATLLEDKPMKHDFPQFLCFIGSDPDHMDDLGAEIEFSLGEEQETHLITTPTLVRIPSGLLHCPLNYKKITRPVYHLDFYFGAEYKRIY